MKIFAALIILMLISSASISGVQCDLVGHTKKKADFWFEMEDAKRVGDDFIPYKMLFRYKNDNFKEYSAEHCVVHLVYNEYAISSKSTIKCSKKEDNPFNNVFYKFNKKIKKFVCMEGCTELIPNTLSEEACNDC